MPNVPIWIAGGFLGLYLYQRWLSRKLRRNNASLLSITRTMTDIATRLAKELVLNQKGKTLSKEEAEGLCSFTFSESEWETFSEVVRSRKEGDSDE